MMWRGILIPFLGTALGAACVFFMRKELGDSLRRAMTGFAAGVMTAASIWSLLIPSLEQSDGMGAWSFVPPVVGFWIGILFLLLLDRLRRTTMLTLAVLLHNIPEGMVIGVLYAGLASDSAQLTAAGALTLSLGIAIQNFPEGVIVSMPLRTEGFSKPKAFGYGLLTGVVEPLGALLMILAAHILVPALPYLLGFAAGAMIYVVVEELIPEMSAGGHSDLGTLFFALGFTMMMVLDVAFG